MLELDVVSAINPLHAQPCLNALSAAIRAEMVELIHASADNRTFARSGRTAVIPLLGFLNRNYNAGEYATSTLWAERQLRTALADAQVDNIVLRVDSPGGSVSGIIELAETVGEAAQQKPVIAAVDGMAASAAYWVSARATRVVSGKHDTIGSIGVVTAVYDFSKMYEEAGIKVIPITTGKFKAAGMPGTEVTDEQVEEIQKRVDAYYAEFKSSIARGRRLSADQVSAVADGRVWFGHEAVGLGLVDSNASFSQTLQAVTVPSRVGLNPATARAQLAALEL